MLNDRHSGHDVALYTGGMLALRFGSFRAGGEWRIGCIVSSSRGEGRGPEISPAGRSYCDVRAQVKRVRLKKPKLLGVAEI